MEYHRAARRGQVAPQGGRTMPIRSRLVTLGLVAALATLLAQAADIVKPNIKLGLWEITTTTKMAGLPGMSDEMLAKIPPERRAKMLAALEARSGKPHVAKQCMTEEKIARGFKTDEGDSCTRQVLASSATEVKVHDECTTEQGKRITDAHFQMTDHEHMTGTVHVVMTRGERTMNLDGTLEGKWLSASCGNVKDVEVEK
jgi:hypothetical protein